jgi:hypothetical protein
VTMFALQVATTVDRLDEAVECDSVDIEAHEAHSARKHRAGASCSACGQ